MSAILCTFLMACTTGFAFAQFSITGTIADNKQKLPSTRVLLLRLDSTMLKGVVTDTDGRFIFKNVASGSYLISASMIGYSQYHSPGAAVVIDKDVTLQEITLEEFAATLDEVIVAENRQLFEQKPDRLVINMESSITLSGNSILEVLQKAPGVVINRQNNSVSLNGKSGVRIMINEKIVQVPMDVAFQMLEGMNSANIEKIELISTPPSKYDAEGTAGIIHIVTKTNENMGTNGTLGVTVGARWAEAAGANFNLNHRGEKFSYFIDYSLSVNHNLHIMKMERALVWNGFKQIVKDSSHRENFTTQQNLNAGLEFNISKNSFVNFQIAGFRRHWDLNAYTRDINQIATDSATDTEMNINELNLWQSVSGSIGMRTKIDKKSEFSLGFDYLYYHNENLSSYDNTLLDDQDGRNEVSKIDINKETPIQFYIIKADYQNRISSSFFFEAGIKSVTSTLSNNVLVQRMQGDKWITDQNFSSFSNLNEQISAAYVSTTWQLTPRWEINSGLRYEYTHTKIGTPTTKLAVDRKYGYFFPTIILKKKLGVENDFQFSYSRRLTRPTYNDIAPYVFFWGPNTFSAGNTSLYPAIADAITANYHIRQLIFSLQFTHVQKEIVFLQPQIDTDSNTLTYRSENLRFLNTLALTSSYVINILPTWELQSNITALYQVAETAYLTNNVVLKQYGLNLNLANIFKLPRNFAIEISGTFQSKALSGISQFLPMGSLNAGIQKTFGKKGILRLSMDDILYTNYWRIKTDSPENNLQSYFDYNWHNQFIRMTYSRNFGKNKLASLKLKSGSEEERKRISN